MPPDNPLLSRDRLDAEILIIRSRDASLADFLNCPVPITAQTDLRLRSGSELSPSRGLERILRRGWSFLEHWGVWSEGKRSTLQISFDRSVVFPVKIELELEGFVRSDVTQSIGVSVNGRKAAVLAFGPECKDRVEAIQVTAEDVSSELSAVIAFDVSNPTAPSEIESSSDGRKLGVAIKRLRVL
jgi:hypothetical protein